MAKVQIITAHGWTDEDAVDGEQDVKVTTTFDIEGLTEQDMRVLRIALGNTRMDSFLRSGDWLRSIEMFQRLKKMGV